MITTLIIGASAGIGLELAKLFAASGDNTVLTARSEDNLIELGNELQTLHNIIVTVIFSDLSKLG